MLSGSTASSTALKRLKTTLFRRPFIKRGRGGVYQAWGRTDSGRYLLVIFRYMGHNRAWPITAREMDENEKRHFRKK